MADSGNIWAATIPADGAAVFAAPLGTPLPTSATASLNAAFVDLGWVSEDGVTNAITRDVTRHKAWGGETVKTTQDNYDETVQFALLESSANVLGVVYGDDNVTESSGSITVEHSSLQLTRQSFVVDFIDGDRVGRIVIKEGLVTQVGDVRYSHRDMTMYDLTVDVYRPVGQDTAVVTYLDYSPGS
jgi:hypothetical protein